MSRDAITVRAEWSSWHTGDLRAEFEGSRLWTPEVWLDRAAADAERAGERLCVIDESGALTRAEAFAGARRFAAFLYERGVRADDIVTVLLPNWREFAVAHHAVGLLGAVLNPVLPNTSADDLAHILRTCGTRYVIAAENHRDGHPQQVAAVVSSDISSVIGITPVRGGSESLAEILELPWEKRTTLPTVQRDSRSWDTVTFTSGTSALPKAVVHTHQSSMFGLRAYIAGVLGLTSGDVVFMPSPLCHATGLQWGLRTALYVGAPLVLQDQWDPVLAIRLIDQHRCTYSLAAATFVVDLLRAKAAGAGSGATLRYVATGGAPIPRHLVAETRAGLGAELLAVFGASETYIATATRPGSTAAMLATDGAPLDGVELLITDEAGNPLPEGIEGEIVTRGPHVFAGYLGDPDLTRQAFRGEWYRFGDVGYLDNGGMLHVTGRIKDIVIRGGENISACEVEDHLLHHPDIIDAAVVGYPDDRLGERCCAVIVPRDDAAITLELLSAFLSKRGLARFKRPERLELVNELPRTATGKVRKSELRRSLAESLPRISSRSGGLL